MLKIKDNVDLKELEKYGFKEYNDCYSRDYNNDYLNPNFSNSFKSTLSLIFSI